VPEEVVVEEEAVAVDQAGVDMAGEPEKVVPPDTVKPY
jgi:hypothetical protein